MTLDDLIKAVEAGDDDAVRVGLGDMASAAHDKGKYLPAYEMLKAYRGSLDEAKAVHDALLPGWKVRIDTGLKHRTWVLGDNGVKIDAYADNPARAWLLAILKAKQAEGRG